VGFIEDAQIKGVPCCAGTHDGRRLIGRENDFYIICRMREEAGDFFRVGINTKLNIRGTDF
jgi:hypothetical protein